MFARRCTVLILLLLLSGWTALVHGQVAPSQHWPRVGLGPSFGFYPPEGGLGSGRWGATGYVTLVSSTSLSLAAEAEYQPLFQNRSRFRGFNPFPPPGGFVDQSLVSTHSVARFGGRLSWAPGPRWLYLTAGDGVGLVRRREERVEKDSLGAVISHSDQTFQQASIALSGGLGGRLGQLGPIAVALETQGILAARPADDSGPLAFLTLSLRFGWVR